MKLVIATRNLSKTNEMKEILAEHLHQEFDIQTLNDYPPFEEPIESGVTYVENATIKATTAANATGQLCIADDAGLEIESLNGEPGLFSKRFGGELSSFDEKIQLILSKLSGQTCRKARFRCAVTVAAPRKQSKSFESICNGEISELPRGSGGFGYDSIFIYTNLGLTFAEMAQAQKNRVSHRGVVLKQAADWLKSADFRATN